MFEPVAVYSLSGEFRGYAIHKQGVMRLQSVNLWEDTPQVMVNFHETLRRLNDEQSLREHWPDAGDPEVSRLINDPDWEPLELFEADVPDWDKSLVIEDEFGGMDMERSTIVYKKGEIPDPTQAQQRVFKAMELVARQKAGLA